MNLVPTELNQKLASTVHYAVSAERFYIQGKSGFWRLVGIGLVLFGLGAAGGIALFGYANITRALQTNGELAGMISKALSDTRITATGDGMVTLEPHELTLASGQTVSIDPNSRLLLDPFARVLANGEITIQGPAISAPAGGQGRSLSQIPDIVNFTVFKGVSFGKGAVQTGWIFLTSAQRSPTQQYCYYTEASETPGRNVMLDIGFDGKIETPKLLPENFDLEAAFRNCAWFRSETP